MGFTRQTIVAALVAAGLGATGAVPAQSARSPGGGRVPAGQHAQLTSQDREFMEDAAQSGMAEVQASELVANSAGDPQLRKFAERMLTDHRRANQRLQQLAQRKEVDLPDGPSFLQQGRLQLLKMRKPGEFRQEYVEGFGVDAHQSAVSLFQNEVEIGKDPDVVAFARETLPTLKQHLTMARQLRRDQHAGDRQPQGGMGAAAASSSGRDATERADSGEARETRHEIDEAVQVVQRMKGDPQVRDALTRAKGVFILPVYGRGALGVGAQGGSGVLVTRQGDGFSNPVFYNLGGVSIGAQAGAAGGPLAMLLMSDKAVQAFRSSKNFSLNADAGLTIADWSRRAQASGGKVQDVLVWSGTKGVYAGASLAATDIWYDRNANQAYYGRTGLQPSRILDGSVEAPGNNVLGMVLAV